MYFSISIPGDLFSKTLIDNAHEKRLEYEVSRSFLISKGNSVVKIISERRPPGVYQKKD